MLAWALHRVTGVAVLAFLLLHIIETSMILFGEDAYTRALSLYKVAWFKPIEFLLVAAVIYHAGNGLLVMALDFVPGAARAYRRIFWVGAVAYAAVIAPVAWIMLQPLWK